MEREANHLRPLRSATGEGAAVFFLTGERFWYQTAFCAYSLLQQTEAPVKISVVDDGTLTADQAAILAQSIPGLRVIWANELEEKLNAHLPASRFPTLRRRRVAYPHLRKLTDVHAGSAGWKLVVDSDMLFHGRPKFIMDWLTNPRAPLYMVDVASAYGYSPDLMMELAGAPIPPRVNVGLCGLCSESIDWERLEAWCRAMVEREGSHYLQEQALVAMLMAGRTCAVAPASEYIVMPSRADTEGANGVLHHYVAESKAWYFRYGWRHILRRSRGNRA